MTKSLLLRRGTSIEHALFTGLKSEITFDTEKNTAVVHDGETLGGFPMAREDLSNISDARLQERGIAKSDLSNVSLEDIDARGIARSDLANISDELLNNRGIAKTDLSNMDERAYAAVGKKGIIEIANTDDVLLATDNTKAITPQGLGTYMLLNGSGGGSPMGYMFGFTVNKTGDKSIAVGAGQAKSSDNSVDIILSSPIAKRLDLEWGEGENAGAGTASELLPNTMYHIFVIADENGQGDVGIDTNRTAYNLMQRLLPYEYTKYRKIAAFWTDGDANIVEHSIAGCGTFKSNWFESTAGMTTTVEHNLNVLETDQRVRFLIQLQTDANHWRAGDIIELCYNDHSDNIPSANHKDFGAVLKLERNSCSINFGATADLFFQMADGSQPMYSIGKYGDFVKYMMIIEYPEKYDS